MIIKIKNLRLKTIIGIYDYEQKIDRDIIINATIKTNFNDSLVTDDINDAIDYDIIINQIKDIVQKNKFKLVEKLAQEILDSIMKDKKINYCCLEVDKVGARNDTDSFAVILEKTRN